MTLTNQILDWIWAENNASVQFANGDLARWSGSDNVPTTDEVIAAAGTSLLKSLQHGVSAFRELETRVTIQRIDHVALTRQRWGITGGYLDSEGRLKDANNPVPGPTATELVEALKTLLVVLLEDETLFHQVYSDSKTSHTLKHLDNVFGLIEQEAETILKGTNPTFIAATQSCSAFRCLTTGQCRP